MWWVPKRPESFVVEAKRDGTWSRAFYFILFTREAGFWSRGLCEAWLGNRSYKLRVVPRKGLYMLIVVSEIQWALFALLYPILFVRYRVCLLDICASDSQ